MLPECIFLIRRVAVFLEEKPNFCSYTFCVRKTYLFAYNSEKSYFSAQHFLTEIMQPILFAFLGQKAKLNSVRV